MKVFTFCSFKGGTSKTSTALHLGACLAELHNKRVLLVDFDPQANLSVGLGFGPDNLNTMVPVLEGKKKIIEVISYTSLPHLNVIASNSYLDGIEKTSPLVSDPYSHERLRKALKDIQNDYDYCFIDTPPSLGWLTQSAFFASHHSLICSIPEAYSIIGLRRLQEFHEAIRQHHDISALGVILSLWDERGAVNHEFLVEINNQFPDKTFHSKIRRDMSVSRCSLHGKTVFEYDKSSRAGEDYKLLTNEFLEIVNDINNI